MMEVKRLGETHMRGNASVPHCAILPGRACWICLSVCPFCHIPPFAKTDILTKSTNISCKTLLYMVLIYY